MGFRWTGTWARQMDNGRTRIKPSIGRSQREPFPGRIPFQKRGRILSSLNGGSMSVFISHAARVGLAGILACGPAIAATGCSHATAGRGEPSGAERPRVSGTRDERAVRRFPGVDVFSTPHGGFYIHILGGLTANAPPLYIIDGNPMDIDPRHGIDWVAIEDIVDIKVLKNSSDVAVYGPRGANGVILLTTRQAARRRRSPQGRSS